MDARFFDSADTFRDWLRENHESEGEIVIGFNKKGSGLGGLTIAEALDEALCYGWIDGIRRGRDSMTYTNRFTPRRARSIWSHVNVKRVGELTALGLMQPSGLSAFDRRTPERTGAYSAEQGRTRTRRSHESGLTGRSGRVGLLRTAAPDVPKGGHLVAAVGEEGRDEAAPPGATHRGVGGGPKAAAVCLAKSRVEAL